MVNMCGSDRFGFCSPKRTHPACSSELAVSSDELSRTGALPLGAFLGGGLFIPVPRNLGFGALCSKGGLYSLLFSFLNSKLKHKLLHFMFLKRKGLKATGILSSMRMARGLFPAHTCSWEGSGPDEAEWEVLAPSPPGTHGIFYPRKHTHWKLISNLHELSQPAFEVSASSNPCGPARGHHWPFSEHAQAFPIFCFS